MGTIADNRHVLGSGVPNELDRMSQQEMGAALLNAEEVGRILGVSPKRVYGLCIPQVRLSTRRIRWSQVDVLIFIEARRGQSAA